MYPCTALLLLHGAPCSDHNDNRVWSCTSLSCSTCNGLVGTWSCPGFYNSVISISSETNPNPQFTSVLSPSVANVSVCYSSTTSPTYAPTSMPTTATPTSAPSTSTTTTATTHTAIQNFRREDAAIRAEIRCTRHHVHIPRLVCLLSLFVILVCTFVS
jgi:hypothetical protein